VASSVPDPDPNPAPPDPHVLGPPGSGSTIQMYGSGSRFMDPDPDHGLDPDPSIIMQKIVRKTLIPTILLFFDFLSVKIDVNVPSKSNKQKKLC
jgi:hypothetical protein